MLTSQDTYVRMFGCFHGKRCAETCDSLAWMFRLGSFAHIHYMTLFTAQNGETPLRKAVINGRFDIVRYLLERHSNTLDELSNVCEDTRMKDTGKESNCR